MPALTRRNSLDEREVGKVGVLGDQYVSVVTGESPNHRVRCAIKSRKRDVGDSWVDAGESPYESTREVLIEP